MSKQDIEAILDAERAANRERIEKEVKKKIPRPSGIGDLPYRGKHRNDSDAHAPDTMIPTVSPNRKLPDIKK